MTTGGGEEKNPPKIKNPSKIKNLRFFQNTLFLNHFVHLRIPGSLIFGCFRSLSVLKYIFTFVLTKVRENGKFSCVYFYVDNRRKSRMRSRTESRTQFTLALGCGRDVLL